MNLTSWPSRHRVFAWLALGLAAGLFLIVWRFQSDFNAARNRVSQGSILADTRCGPIEYQEAGAGFPLLAIHGSGGGYDRGMAFAAPLLKHGIRVIAMSRFGYLRTPMPVDSSPAAQAEALVCLLETLDVREAAILAYSAGAPSAVQMAIRHPNRVSALVLLAPIVYQPQTQARVSGQLPHWVETTSAPDFLLWSALHVARNRVVKAVLGTPPQLLASASPTERARINEILENIMPVAARAAGSRSDSAIMRHLTPSPLESIRAPTLVFSSRDDGYRTFASAEYTANQIAGAKFIGFEQGGHTWVGHNDEVMSAIVKLVVPLGTPAKP